LPAKVDCFQQGARFLRPGTTAEAFSAGGLTKRKEQVAAWTLIGSEQMKRSSHRRHHPQLESAAHHLVETAPTATGTDTVAEALRRLGSEHAADATSVYVVDPGHQLVGVVPIGELLRQPPDRPLGEIMGQPPPVVALEMDQEHVANTALRHHLTAVPVADSAGRFLGVVPARALLQILRHEHVEDLHRMAGIQRESVQARHALEATPVRRARDRLPWLLVGLAGSMVATAVVDGFEQTLQVQLVVAFFMPGLVYLTDAIGTQSEAIMVRGLSTTHQPAGKLLWGELRTGLLLGVVLGALVFAGVMAAYQNLRLALAVGGTVVTAGLTACTVGMGLPWLLNRLGRDPAFGSGPLGTIIQDVLTLLIYFLAVSWLL
jgi:magnesium transporter